MGIGCKFLCDGIKSGTLPRYKFGDAHCTICSASYYIQTRQLLHISNSCPCCSARLRFRAHSGRPENRRFHIDILNRKKIRKCVPRHEYSIF